MRVSQWRAIPVVCLAVSLAASGCSSASTAGTSSGESSLTVAVAAAPAFVDPNGSVTGANAAGASALINYTTGLLKWKPLPANSQNLGDLTGFSPDLATSYSITPEGVVFQLRAAKSPAGNELSADDVVYSYQRAAAISAAGKFLLTSGGFDLSNPATALGPHSVRLNGKVTPIWPIAAVFYSFSILDSKEAKAHVAAGDPWSTAYLVNTYPGFGPYAVASLDPNQRLTLKANPNYFGPKPAYSTVVLTGFGGQSSAALLGSNAVQVTEQTPLVDFSKTSKSNQYHTLAAPSAAQESIRLNPALKPFADQKVRQAMSMALDRALIVKGPYFGIGSPAQSVVSSTILAASPTLSKVSGQYFKFDLAQAKQLLAQSGYPNGFNFTLTVNQGVLSSGVDGQAVATDVQSMLKPLNINVEIQVEANASTFAANYRAKKYDAFYWSETPLIPDAPYAMNSWHTAGGGSNPTGENDPIINAAIKDAYPTPVGAARDTLAKTAIEAFNTNMYDLPLVDVKVPFATRSSVCGLAPAQALVLNVASLKPC